MREGAREDQREEGQTDENKLRAALTNVRTAPNGKPHTRSLVGQIGEEEGDVRYGEIGHPMGKGNVNGREWMPK